MEACTTATIYSVDAFRQRPNVRNPARFRCSRKGLQAAAWMGSPPREVGEMNQQTGIGRLAPDRLRSDLWNKRGAIQRISPKNPDACFFPSSCSTKPHLLDFPKYDIFLHSTWLRIALCQHGSRATGEVSWGPLCRPRLLPDLSTPATGHRSIASERRHCCWEWRQDRIHGA